MAPYKAAVIAIVGEENTVSSSQRRHQSVLPRPASLTGRSLGTPPRLTARSRGGLFRMGFVILRHW